MSVARLNPLYRLQFEKAQDCHVLLFPEGMIKLNPSAAQILLHIDGVREEQAIYASLRESFPDAPEDMEQDVSEFLAHALEKDWIIYD
jgi:pyrroloquinoline quinone biosynthesis protein D